MNSYKFNIHFQKTYALFLFLVGSKLATFVVLSFVLYVPISEAAQVNGLNIIPCKCETYSEFQLEAANNSHIPVASVEDTKRLFLVNRATKRVEVFDVIRVVDDNLKKITVTTLHVELPSDDKQLQDLYSALDVYHNAFSKAAGTK